MGEGGSGGTYRAPSMRDCGVVAVPEIEEMGRGTQGDCGGNGGMEGAPGLCSELRLQKPNV